MPRNPRPQPDAPEAVKAWAPYLHDIRHTQGPKCSGSLRVHVAPCSRYAVVEKAKVAEVLAYTHANHGNVLAMQHALRYLGLLPAETPQLSTAVNRRKTDSKPPKPSKAVRNFQTWFDANANRLDIPIIGEPGHITLTTTGPIAVKKARARKPAKKPRTKGRRK